MCQYKDLFRRKCINSEGIPETLLKSELKCILRILILCAPHLEVCPKITMSLVFWQAHLVEQLRRVVN